MSDNGAFVWWIDRQSTQATTATGSKLPPLAGGRNAFHRPGEVLVHQSDEAAVVELLNTRHNLDARLDSPDDDRSWRRRIGGKTAAINTRLHGFSSYRVLTLRPDVDDLDSIIGIERPNFDPSAGVRLNTVFFGEGLYHGGPGTAPMPAPAISADKFTPRADAPQVLQRSVDLTVLDTGLPADWADAQSLLINFISSADVILPNELDLLDEDGNNILDLQAAHGLFICGIVNRVAGGIRVDPGKVLSAAGDGDESDIVARLGESNSPVVNLSLGGYTEDDQPPAALQAAISKLTLAGTVVVAAAGNSYESPEFRGRPFWPAALADVVAVGAYDSATGDQAAFSNRGPWVDVWAPGVGITSNFVCGWRGASPPADAEFTRTPVKHGRPPYFNGWASWSGTSFAAPMIAAEIAARAGGAPRSEVPEIAQSFLDSLAEVGWPEGPSRRYSPRVSMTD